MHWHHRFHNDIPILKEVVIKDEVVDVIRQVKLPKGNINNKDNMEDHPNNMAVVAYNLISTKTAVWPK